MIRLGVLGCGSVFWGPYMTLIERLARAGRVTVAAVYDPDAGKRCAAAARLRPRAGAAGPPRRSSSTPDVDLVLVLTCDARARPARARRARGRQARAGREADGDVAAEARRGWSSWRPRRRPGTCCLRPAHPALADLPRDARARAGRRDRLGSLSARARYGWAGPRLGGAGSTSRAAARCSTSASTTSSSLCGFFGPARRVTAMTGVAIPERDHRRRADAGRGRGQRARADRLRRRAASPSSRPASRCRSTARPRSSCTARTACCRCSATTGRPRATSCGATTTAPGSSIAETDPTLAVDRRPAPPRRVHRDRSRAGDPPRARATTRSRSCSPPRPPAPTGARARSRAPSRRPTYASLPVEVGDHRRVHDPRSRCDDLQPVARARRSTGRPRSRSRPSPGTSGATPRRARSPTGSTRRRTRSTASCSGSAPAARSATRASSCTVFGADECCTCSQGSW